MTLQFDVTVRNLSVHQLRELTEYFSPEQQNNQIPLNLPKETEEEIDPTETSGSNSSVDANGLPWDERIHAGSKNFKADGTWKRKPRVTDELVAQVEAELRSAAAPAPVATPAAPAPVAAPAAPAAPAPAPVAAPTAPAPVAAPAAPAPVAVNQRDFSNLVMRINAALQNGSISHEYVAAIVSRIAQQFNVQLVSLPDISAQPLMIEAAHQFMDQDGR